MDEAQAMALLDARSRFGMKPGLDTIRGMLSIIGDPHERVKVVHVAGSNGKGSVCAMVAAALQEAGHRTGLYTSPHLVSFRERIRVNGADITGAELGEAMSALQPALEKYPEATYFEVATALAFWHFAKVGVDIVVLEVGLGGRLDATNVCAAPLVTVVTNVSLEHTDVLGHTEEEIAREKGGIIKQGVPVITAASGGALQEITKLATRHGASLSVLGKGFIAIPGEDSLLEVEGLREYGEVRVPLDGAHQLDNAALALAAVDAVDRAGVAVGVEAAKGGLAKTQWLGRLQTISGSPRLLLDGAHNPAGMHTLAAFLQQQKIRPVVLFGALRDKDWMQMIEILAPCVRDGVVTRVPSARAADPQEGARMFSQMGVMGIAVDDVGHALRTAQGIAGPDGTVLVAGSLYLVGDVLARLG